MVDENFKIVLLEHSAYFKSVTNKAGARVTIHKVQCQMVSGSLKATFLELLACLLQTSDSLGKGKEYSPEGIYWLMEFLRSSFLNLPHPKSVTH